MPDLVRPAERADLPALATLWQNGWHAAHYEHVPKSLSDIRTPESFANRLKDHFNMILTLGDAGTPLGLVISLEAEIYQLFVSPIAQGTGAAAKLILAGEARIKAAGHSVAHLDVIPENGRAIAFYEKMGWQRGEVEPCELHGTDKPYLLPCLVMTKAL
jgi:ribosomal protein S18 acetylase RimI-like enzyme